MTLLGKMIKLPNIILAIGGVALASLLVPARTVSIDWEAGGGEWVHTAYANSFEGLCAQTNPNDVCGEWCEFGPGGTHEGTGQLCCMEHNGVCYAHNVFYP